MDSYKHWIYLDIFDLLLYCLFAEQVVVVGVVVRVMRLHQMGAQVALHWDPHLLVSLLISARRWPGHRIAIDWPINLRTSR